MHGPGVRAVAVHKILGLFQTAHGKPTQEITRNPKTLV